MFGTVLRSANDEKMHPVIWLAVFAVTIGLILLVPTVLQAIDGSSQPVETEGDAAKHVGPAGPLRPRLGLVAFFGFAATTFGGSLIFIDQFPVDSSAALIASATLGLAAGAIHPEVLASLGRLEPQTG